MKALPAVLGAAAERAGRLDLACLQGLVARRREKLDPVALRCSELGRGGLLWLIVLAAVDTRRIGRLRSGLLDAPGISGSYLASLLLSRLIGRRRPCQERLVVPLIDCPRGPSLPSDQAAAAAAGVALALRRRSRIAPPLAALAAMNCTSRVYAGVHYPGDILLGAAFGVIWVETLARVLKPAWLAR